MDLLSIALILVAAWIAIVIVALALARAAGRADAHAARLHEAEVSRDSRKPDAAPSEASPLDALADEIGRAEAARPRSEVGNTPALPERSGAGRRFKRAPRLGRRPGRVKH
jgi:hypothetical protein